MVNRRSGHSPEKQEDRQTVLAYALACALLFFLFFFSLFLRGDDREDFFFREGGVIESASVFGYLLCAAFIIYKRRVADLKYFLVLIIFFILRELDFHERFTTLGIFKTKFFLSEEVGPIQKIVGAAVILVLLYVSICILHRHAKDFLIGVKKHSAISFGSLLAMILLALSKLMDGISGKLQGLGVRFSEPISMHAEAAEEILELGIPIVIFLTLHAYFKEKKVQKRI